MTKQQLRKLVRDSSIKVKAERRLQSAAPALLAAARAAVKRIEWLNNGGPDEPDEILDDLKAAIAAAEGGGK